MVDDKQFILSKEKFVKAGWKHLVLSGDLILSYQEKLKVWSCQQNIVLLGIAWQVDPERKTPEEELCSLAKLDKISNDDVFEMEKTWCGRYVLIVDGWLYLDTVGSLGVFYSENSVSSSLHVLCEAEKRQVIYPNIVWGQNPDFLPGTRTCYEGVSRLLPSQIYNIKDKKAIIRPLLPDGVIRVENDADRVALLESYYIHSLKIMSKLFEGETLYFGLTGGRDSRAAMSLFEKAGIDYHPFTMEYNDIKEADVVIPARLAKKVGKKRIFVKRKEKNFSRQRMDDYCMHTAGMAIDTDRLFYTYGQYSYLFKNQKKLVNKDNDNIVIVRSSIWEITNDYLLIFCKNGQFNIEDVFPYADNEPFIKQSLEEWFDMIVNDKINAEVSYSNRAYWDLRDGCWLSSLEQSFDLMDNTTTLQPLNCRLFVSILMGFGQQDRYKKKHEEYIVGQVCPALLEVPYDYQYRSFYKRVRRMGGKVYRFICKK